MLDAANGNLKYQVTTVSLALSTLTAPDGTTYVLTKSALYTLTPQGLTELFGVLAFGNLAITPDGTKLYIAAANNALGLVVSTATNQPIAKIPTPAGAVPGDAVAVSMLQTGHSAPTNQKMIRRTTGQITSRSRREDLDESPGPFGG